MSTERLSTILLRIEKEAGRVTHYKTRKQIEERIESFRKHRCTHPENRETQENRDTAYQLERYIQEQIEKEKTDPPRPFIKKTHHANRTPPHPAVDQRIRRRLHQMEHGVKRGIKDVEDSRAVREASRLAHGAYSEARRLGHDAEEDLGGAYDEARHFSYEADHDAKEVARRFGHDVEDGLHDIEDEVGKLWHRSERKTLSKRGNWHVGQWAGNGSHDDDY